MGSEELIKRRFIIMVGICGSGKSTHAVWLKNKIKNEYPEYDQLGEANETEIISSDSIREEVFGDVNDQTHNQQVFAEVRKRAIEAIKNKKHVIIDATGLTIKDRRSAISYFDAVSTYRKWYNIEACVMTTEIQECRRRNKERDRVVPNEVITKQIHKFEIPFYGEGFNKIYFDSTYRLSRHNEAKWKKIEDMMKGFDQRNPHHKYDLWTHCNKTAEYLMQEIGESLFRDVGRLHDIGKLFTATPKDDLSGEYRYLSHHNVGAFYLLTNLDILPYIDFERALSLIFYVNYHMFPFFWENDKTKDKYIKLFGEERYERLVIINKCDKKASGTENEN